MGDGRQESEMVTEAIYEQASCHMFIKTTQTEGALNDPVDTGDLLEQIQAWNWSNSKPFKYLKSPVVHLPHPYPHSPNQCQNRLVGEQSLSCGVAQTPGIDIFYPFFSKTTAESSVYK